MLFFSFFFKRSKKENHVGANSIINSQNTLIRTSKRLISNIHLRFYSFFYSFFFFRDINIFYFVVKLYYNGSKNEQLDLLHNSEGAPTTMLTNISSRSQFFLAFNASWTLSSAQNINSPSNITSLRSVFHFCKKNWCKSM